MKKFLRDLSRHIKFLLLLLVDALVIATTPKTPRSNCVLLVRLDAIGDFVLWLDAAESLSRRYRSSGRRLVLVANTAWASWAKDLKLFDEVIPVNTREFQRDLLYRYHVGRSIRRLGCALAVQPTYSRFWLLGDAVIRLSGAAERVGSTGDPSHCAAWQLRIADRWYTSLVRAHPAQMTEVERNAEFMRQFGEPNFAAKLTTIDLAGGNALEDDFTRAIGGAPYYVLFPGASWKLREWPAANFREIAGKLHAETGWQGVICGGPQDVGLAGSILEGSSALLLNWAGRTDLAQLAVILSHAKLLVSNETSAAHIAAAAGVPTICIVGGGHYGRFLPYKLSQHDGRPLPRVATHRMPCFGCDWRCIFSPPPGTPVPCIERIEVAEVWQHTSDMLGLK